MTPDTVALLVGHWSCDSHRGFEFWPGVSLGKLPYLNLRDTVMKQYNLLPVKGRSCPAAGEITVGLASHWSCVTDLSTYRLMVNSKGDENAAYAPERYNMLYV